MQNPDDDRDWIFEVGPKCFWDAANDLRLILPIDLFNAFVLDASDLAEKLTEFTKKHEEILPRNFRALLLLTDTLHHAPWTSLASLRNFWEPLSLAQCAAGFYLSALISAYGLEPSSEAGREVGDNALYYPIKPFSAPS